MAAGLSLMRSSTKLFGYTVLLVTVWLLVGCSNPETELNEQLCNEIILVHDQAMEQTGYLFDLQTQLKQIAADSPTDQKRIARLSAALKDADRAMFSWMNQYQTLAVDGDITVDNAYRKEQLTAIRSVSRITEQALFDAEQFLASVGISGE